MDIDANFDGCQLQFGGDPAQMLDGARAANGAVADKGGGFLFHSGEA